MGDEIKVLKKEDFDAVLAKIQDQINGGKPDLTGFAKLSDIQETLRGWKPEFKVEAAVDGKTAEAALEESGALGGITNLKIWDIPIGKAVAGGAIAILASELVDGFMAKYSKTIKGVSKLVLAGVTIKWLSKPLSKEMAGVVALLLTFDAIRDLTPIDEWMSKAANKVSGIIPTGGLGDQRGGNKVIDQAKRVAADYYARAEGRR
jgi:hypothetical protein